MSVDNRKKSLYFPDAVRSELEAEAKRLDRSISWLLQFAWKNTRTKIMTMPGPNDDETET